VEPAIVAALLREGGHGYDLRKSISEMTGDVVSVDAGGLYRTLRRMEEDGFVTSTWVEGDSGPQKREYQLTAEGYELAEDWIAHLEERARLAAMLADELGSALAATGPNEGGTDD
jgi:DNA-binding PadR family transcriptional regulator